MADLPVVDATGLCMCVRGTFFFLEGIGDLAVAIAWPLEVPLDASLLHMFGEDDPWRKQGDSLARLKSMLTATESSNRRNKAFSQSAEASLECESLRVGVTEAAGRCLRAARPVGRGALLLRETAHAAVLWSHCRRTHCHYCLVFVPPAAREIRCDGCSELYCSVRCHDAAWTCGHDAECGRPLLQCILPRTVLMCMRALCKDDGGTAVQSDLDRLLALHDHQSSMHPTRRSQIRFHAHAAFSALQPALAARSDASSRNRTTPTESQLARLLRLSLTNSFAVRDVRGGAAVGEALFPTASLFNHACEPNTNVRHVGRTLEVRASAALGAGEEALICYGPQAGFMPRPARQEELRRVYHFACGCAACVRESSQRIHEHLGQTVAERRHSQPNPAQQDRTVLRRRAQQLDDRARHACERGAFREAAQLTEHAIALLRGVFPSGSTQLAHEAAKLGQLRFNASADAQAKASLMSAARELAACYGDDHEEVVELLRLAAMCHPAALDVP